MAGRASVEQQAVVAARQVCEQIAREFADTSASLQSKYHAAGTNWSDEKYAALGGIVDDCSGSLTSAKNELEVCIGKLTQIERVIGEYENTRL